MNSPSLVVTAAHFALVFVLVATGKVLFDRSMPLGARGPVRRLAFLGLALAWLGGTWALARAGVLYDPEANPPRVVYLLAPSILGTLILCWSPFADRVLAVVSVRTIAAFQFFRVAVELILWQLAREGLLPLRLTFEGSNPEWIATVTLPIVLWVARGGGARWVLVAWNLLGLATLATIVSLAVRSMPGPWLAFEDGPTNAIVLTSSFVWIPCVYVLTALAAHVVGLRGLLGRK